MYGLIKLPHVLETLELLGHQAIFMYPVKVDTSISLKFILMLYEIFICILDML